MFIMYDESVAYVYLPCSYATDRKAVVNWKFNVASKLHIKVILILRCRQPTYDRFMQKFITQFDRQFYGF